MSRYLSLLDRALPYPSELCHPDAFREDVVYSTVWVELKATSNPGGHRGAALAISLRFLARARGRAQRARPSRIRRARVARRGIGGSIDMEVSITRLSQSSSLFCLTSALVGQNGQIE